MAARPPALNLSYALLVTLGLSLLALLSSKRAIGLTVKIDDIFEFAEQFYQNNSTGQTSSNLPPPFPQTRVRACLETDKISNNTIFRSQSREDTILKELFDGVLCGDGTYLEMGALDGLTYSNSFFFHNTYGWKGVLIEGAPSNYEKLKENRKKEIATVHAAVCEYEQIVHFVDRRAVGGIWEFASEKFRKRWWGDLNIENIPEVKCQPLNQILANNAKGQTHFDFWSLDIEGGELTALKSIDLDKYSFGIILVENNPKNPPENAPNIRALLGSKGYLFHSTKQKSDWFFHKDFPKIYGHDAFSRMK